MTRIEEILRDIEDMEDLVKKEKEEYFNLEMNIAVHEDCIMILEEQLEKQLKEED